ncbi:bifunctional adenosylcobinamide kinase/adenosylcobinamide-phosphate guanylyltransferase [Caulobacter segnis]|uniref:Bifunctional adenosylcobalamin biosynthesis protein n=1 Tax=Caulobacter segnis TaxID=88688 RepID=A0A2W5V7U5_9CAUL|nr:bifunctional adenosylcobinamide kinase/adenosylcobinamide-phosphate guanylyltransferase [Caulobacter segnis]PZR35890.1 MAG: bifunctional adenosylcobinamide kinase/adenosylcobinamide-phosphate guanylyltransferase [Caulobacter segnis]
MTVTLVLGGARSGKSGFAQRAAELAARGERTVMIATGQAFDDEMADRIARHQAGRGESWTTVEAPFELAAAIAGIPSDAAAVVDCLTLWLSNHMLAGHDLEALSTELVEAVAACRARLWLVSNEVGLGIVPETPLGRRFRDEAGRLNQRLAATADEVYFLAAGLPLRMKPHA